MIQGNAPYLVLADGMKLKNLNHLLGFSMPKQDGSRGTELIDATKGVVTAPKGMKLSDVKALVRADNRTYTVPIGNLKDDDGDRGSSSGTMTAVWKNNGQVMSDLNQTLSSCGGPYTLTISTNKAKAQTTYGTPRTTDYGSATKTYAFIANDSGICYIKPQSMDVFTRDTLYPQGYNPAVWDRGKGFSVSKMNAVGKHFPTTGFDKAVFDVIGTGNDQSKYRCSKTGDWVRLSGSASRNLGQNCRVTYNHDKKTGNPTKPTTPITITMEYKNDNNSWTKIDSYTIPVPSKWAISPIGESYRVGYANEQRTQFPALNACRRVGPRADNKRTSADEATSRYNDDLVARQKFMYRRLELTNSKLGKLTDYPNGAGFSGVSNYSRDIGTFMGEWGYVRNYARSPWSAYDWYWTIDIFVNWGNLLYVATNGALAWSNYGLDSPDVVVCRGE